MSNTAIFTRDTKTVRATFTNKVSEDADEEGAIVDPDNQECLVKVYNAEQRVIIEDSGTRVSEGVYEFNWTPTQPGTYWVEFKGFFNGDPQLSRRKFRVKFKGDT
jgi:hypothetical protein